MLCCSFNGISKERDLEERQLTKQAVIQECEDERTRRQKHLSKGSGYWSDHSELSDKSRMRVRIRKYRTEDPDSDDEPLSPQYLVKNSTAFRIPSPSPSLPRNEGSQGRKRNASLPHASSLSNSQSLHHLLRSQVQSVVARSVAEMSSELYCKLHYPSATIISNSVFLRPCMLFSSCFDIHILQLLPLESFTP